MAKLIIEIKPARHVFEIDEEIITQEMADQEASREAVLDDMRNDPGMYFDSWISDIDHDMNIYVEEN